MKREFVTPLALALALGTALCGNVAAFQPPIRQQAAADNNAPEEQELRAALKSETPRAKADAINKFLAAHPKSAFVPVARQLLVTALIEAKAPAAELIAATDAAGPVIEDEVDRGRMYNSAAFALAERDERLDAAATFAAKALAAIPNVDELVEERATIEDTLGWILVRRGEYAKAIDNLLQASHTLPESQEILYHLGVAYEKAGQTDKAIDAYVRSEAVFLGTDTTAVAPLRALYQKAHGSLDGLDARLAAAASASKQMIVFDSRRVDKPAPHWELQDLSGKPVKLADFKGKTIVMDFWGSWCGPCRAELPKFQALYNKYKDNDKIVFLGMNWERGNVPEARLKMVNDFMAKNSYTFPVIIDHDRVAVESYKIQGFPTVYIIDPAGNIKYQNIGFEDGVDQILEAQIDSMLK